MGNSAGAHVAARHGPGSAPVDLGLLTAAIAGNFRSACDGAQLALRVNCPPLAEPLCVDRDAWEKIVMGLLADAMRYPAQDVIEVRLRAEHDHAHLTVRASGTATRRGAGGDGTGRRSGPDGAGLTAVRELVEQHCGELLAACEPGSGAAYSVRVPLAPLRAGRREEAHAVAARQVSAFVEDLVGRAGASAACETGALPVRGRIVVVDDHADMQDYLTLVLESGGFEVEVLADGARALAACIARPPDAVISDVVMPGLDGFELIDRLRADERTVMTPVLLLSGRTSEESRMAGLAAGADDFLVKPVRRRELLARVEGAIRVARLRAEAARRDQADLEALFSAGPDGVLVIGEGGSVLTANGRAQALFGCPEGTLVGRPVAAVMPQLAQWARPAARLVSPIQELEAVRCDGSVFVAEVVLGPLQRYKNEACTIAIVRDVTERRKLEVEREAQEQRFRELSHRLVEVQETERRLLATELHDRTSPNLAAIRINVKLLTDLLRPAANEDIAALLDDTCALVEETTLTIREISSNLRPTALDDGGLLAAVAGYARQFMERTGIEVDIDVAGDAAGLPPEVRSSVFRVVQEALANCAKHAAARLVAVRLHVRAAALTLVVADDGCGFDAAAARAAGLGLLTMRERVEFAGGALMLSTAPGRGTRIEVRFLLDAQRHEADAGALTNR